MKFHYALSADTLDLGQLRDALAGLENIGIDEVVIDAMDGAFAPAYGFGARFVEAMAACAPGIARHVHLMAHEPDRRIADIVAAGASIVTVHAEACVHAHRVLDHIRSLGAQPGIALRPATPLTTLEYLLPGADRAVLLADEPGIAPRKPGQALFERIKLLRDTLNYRELTTRTQVRVTADAYSIARLQVAGAHGVIVSPAVPETPGPFEPLTPDALLALQQDALARGRALDFA